MERLKAKKEENPGAQNDRHSLYNSTTPPGVSELQRDAATSMPAVLSYPRDLNITAPAKAIVDIPIPGPMAPSLPYPTPTKTMKLPWYPLSPGIPTSAQLGRRHRSRYTTSPKKARMRDERRILRQSLSHGCVPIPTTPVRPKRTSIIIFLCVGLAVFVCSV